MNRDPLRLCQFLLKECLDVGINLHHPAKAVSILANKRNEIIGVRIQNTETGIETTLPCSNLVIAAGVWSPGVFATLFPQSSYKLPVASLAGHSLVVKSPRWSQEQEHQGCHAIFMVSQPGYSPEIFSRIGGHIYVAGLNSTSLPIPDIASDSKANVQQDAVAKLRNTARDVLGLGSKSKTDDLEVVRESLCFRPITDNGLPILSRVPDLLLGLGRAQQWSGGVYVASGHGPWGISMSLGTGKVMAEMIQGRQPSADISALNIQKESYRL